MKKSLSFFLVSILLFSLISCKKKDVKSVSKEKVSINDSIDFSSFEDSSVNGNVKTNLTFAQNQERIAGKEEDALETEDFLVNNEDLIFVSEESDLQSEFSDSEEDEVLEIEKIEQAVRAPENDFYSIESQVMSDKNGNLVFDKIDEELFIPYESNGQKVLVRKTSDSLVRGFYDSNGKILKKQWWSMSSFSESEITRTESYKYSNNQLSSYESEDKDYIFHVVYDSTGNITTEEKIGKYEGKKFLLLRNSYTRKKGHLDSVKTIEYSYSKENYGGKSSAKYKLWKYIQNEDDLPDNEEYYEENILKSSKKYTGLEQFEQITYFDDGFSVKTVWDGSEKISEVMYKDGKVLRVKK